MKKYYFDPLGRIKMRRRGSENINFWWGMWWIAVAIFFLGIVCLLTGCGAKGEVKDEAGRFEKVSSQKFGTENVKVFRDTETGIEYLFIDGIYKGGVVVMPQSVEEENFTGETEPMVFSSAPTATVAKMETVEEPEQETEHVTVIRNDEGIKGDLELLALVIYQEAGGDMCSDECRQMVGEVVLNRVKDKRYPCTIEGVITQRAQYGRLHWTGPVWPERANNPGEQHAVERAYATAWALLIDDVERLLPEDVIYQAEFEQGKETVAEADGFYFCR